MSILLVEQNARLALQVAQRGYVMESGAITLSGAAKQMLGRAAVVRAERGIRYVLIVALLIMAAKILGVF